MQMKINLELSNENKLFETITPGAYFSFSFEGTMFGIKDIVGSQGCRLDISVDGERYSKLRFDKYCTYDRTHYTFIPDLEEGVHQVEVKLSNPLLVEEKIDILKIRTPDAEKFPKNMEVNKFRLKEIMILENIDS